MSAGNDQRSLNLEAAAVQAAGGGIQTLLILNGGACLGVLSLYGVLLTTTNVKVEYLPLIAAMPCALLSFAVGAFLTIPLWVCAYKANQEYANASQNFEKDWPKYERLWKRGQKWNEAGMLFVLPSTVCFLLGVTFLYCSLPVIQPKKVDDGERCIVCVFNA